METKQEDQEEEQWRGFHSSLMHFLLRTPPNQLIILLPSKCYWQNFQLSFVLLQSITELRVVISGLGSHCWAQPWLDMTNETDQSVTH